MTKTATPISTTVTTPVPAELVLRPAYGDERPVTAETLTEMGWELRSEMYRRMSTALALAATGDADTDLTRGHEAANLIRYFIEVAINYESTPEAVLAHFADGDDTELAKLRALLNEPLPS